MSIRMKASHHSGRLRVFAKIVGATLAVLFVNGPAALAEPAPIVFVNENRSDGGGVFNVIQAFKEACLTYSTTKDLPEKIAPEGFKVVTLAQHWGWAPGEETPAKALVISKTGLADDDEAGGFPFVTISIPERDPNNGLCAVDWKRSWDYSGDIIEKISLSIAALIDRRISYYTGAVLASAPDRHFVLSDIYFLTSEWYAPCMDDRLCHFSVGGTVKNDEGIHLTMSRQYVQSFPDR